jgi:hypothetical protein
LEKLRDDSSFIIILSPEQHFHFYLNGGQVIYPEMFAQVRATAGYYDLILSKKKGDQLTDEQWKHFESQAATMKSEYDDRVNQWIEEVINSYKREHELTTGKKAYLASPEGVQDHLHQITMPLIITLFTGIQRTDIHEIETDDIKKFQPFTYVINQWTIDLDLGEANAEVNDIIDVFNMIFVTPIDKYWTEEKTMD